MTVLDQHNRSLTVAEANELAMRESEGRLGFVEEGAGLVAVYRRLGPVVAAGYKGSQPDADDSPAPQDRRIAMPHLALTAWGIFEMARAARPKPEPMICERTSGFLVTQPA
jgi:hypothetical protein